MKRTKRFLNLDNPFGKLSQSSQSKAPSSPSSHYGSLFNQLGAARLGNEQSKELMRGSDRLLSQDFSAFPMKSKLFNLVSEEDSNGESLGIASLQSDKDMIKQNEEPW